MKIRLQTQTIAFALGCAVVLAASYVFTSLKHGVETYLSEQKSTLRLGMIAMSGACAIIGYLLRRRRPMVSFAVRAGRGIDGTIPS